MVEKTQRSPSETMLSIPRWSSELIPTRKILSRIYRLVNLVDSHKINTTSGRDSLPPFQKGQYV